MVKIKRKVEMTCGEFAKYMVDKFGFSSYEVKLSDGYWVGNPEREYDVSIHLPPSKVSDLPDITITKSGVVIFEVEEEITEDTHLDYLYALTNDDEKEIHRCMNFTIRNASMVIGRNDLTFFTLIDNDLVKIYENGKLVE